MKCACGNKNFTGSPDNLCKCCMWLRDGGREFLDFMIEWDCIPADEIVPEKENKND